MIRFGEQWVRRVWYGRSKLYLLLLPLAWLYAGVTGLRRRLYRKGVLRVTHPGVPVIVVGNVTVGGTGKTPVTIWLARQLAERGFAPGIVSRGYRGNVGRKPVLAKAESDPAVVGDEAVLLAAHGRCPVVVHPDRVAAARMLADLDVDVILSDDGLQHYRLARDYEIAVMDGVRRFGNGRLLPAGPLREPIARFDEVDQVLAQRNTFGDDNKAFRRTGDRTTSDFRLVPSAVCSLDDEEIRRIEDFEGQRVHVLAGIGNPQRFFSMLEACGMQVIEHPLPDHALLSADDLNFGDGLSVMMTEKDAVKCRNFGVGNCWYVPVYTEFEQPPSWLDALQAKLEGLRGDNKS